MFSEFVSGIGSTTYPTRVVYAQNLRLGKLHPLVCVWRGGGCPTLCSLWWSSRFCIALSRTVSYLAFGPDDLLRSNRDFLELIWQATKYVSGTSILWSHWIRLSLLVSAESESFRFEAVHVTLSLHIPRRQWRWERGNEGKWAQGTFSAFIRLKMCLPVVISASKKRLICCVWKAVACLAAVLVCWYVDKRKQEHRTREETLYRWWQLNHSERENNWTFGHNETEPH